MNEGARLRRRGTLSASLCVLLVALGASAVADGSRARAPVRLVDGSVAAPTPVPLRGLRRRLVTTRVRLARAKELRALVAACVPGDAVPGWHEVIERVGVNGRSITFRGLSPSVDACDRRRGAVPRPWCGRAAWTLRRGRVSDPRLSICQDIRGRAVAAFAWINPLSRTRWIVVDQPSFGEVYPVAGGLPVRVVTVDGIGAGRARFRYAQYGAKGTLLARAFNTRPEVSRVALPLASAGKVGRSLSHPSGS